MKVAYLTGSRADFGLMRKILQGIQTDKNLDLILLATGMHLLKEFGETIIEVKKDFTIQAIEAIYEKDNRESMAKFLGKCTLGVVDILIKNKPDVIMALGDRAEQLAMAQAAAYLNIPLIHLHGGEVTTTIDDKARNAISMLADWHLTATKRARKRLIKMGVDKKRVKVVGAPGLDEINKLVPASKKDLIVVLQHPDENENQASKQIKETLEAVLKFKLETKIIYPNSDAGGRAMIKIIDEYVKKYPILKAYSSIPRDEFIDLLNKARVLVGNSSAGLIEAPSLNLAVVNVGPRQKGREKGKNVIEADNNQKRIEKAISKALGLRLNKTKNPYGDGKTALRVIKFLKSL